MPRHWLSKLLALCVAITPAAAQEFNIFTPYGKRQPSMTRGTCVTDTTNATTYNSVGFQATGTGASDGDQVLVVVGVVSEDSASAYGVSSMTIDGVTATEVVDEDASSVGMNAAIYRAAALASGAATVNVSVTFTEAITSATVCAWALKDLVSMGQDGAIADDESLSADLVLTTDPTRAPGFVVGVTGLLSGTASNTVAWTNINEQQDAENGECQYSNADAATTGASMSITANWTDDGSSGATAAFH